MAAGYTVETAGDVALSAATAKTVLNVIPATNAPLRIVEVGVSFDGTSTTDTPIVVELCASTQATAGTKTTQAPVQIRGPLRTVQAAGARSYSAEPTVLTTLKRWRIHPQAGILYLLPLGREIEAYDVASATKGLCLRVTSAQSMNVQGYIEFEEG